MAALAASMQALGASMQASVEVEQRLKQKARAGQRMGIVVVFCFGAVLALGGVGLAIIGLLEFAGYGIAGSSGSELGGGVAALVPAAILGGLGGFLLFLGAYNLRNLVRADRLRAVGLRGRATVDSYRERGNNTFQLVLHVELPSRPPYDVRTKQYLGSNWMKITTHAELPVLVSPNDPNDLMFDLDG